MNKEVAIAQKTFGRLGPTRRVARAYDPTLEGTAVGPGVIISTPRQGSKALMKAADDAKAQAELQKKDVLIMVQPEITRVRSKHDDLVMGLIENKQAVSAIAEFDKPAQPEVDEQDQEILPYEKGPFPPRKSAGGVFIEHPFTLAEINDMFVEYTKWKYSKITSSFQEVVRLEMKAKEIADKTSNKEVK